MCFSKQDKADFTDTPQERAKSSVEIGREQAMVSGGEHVC